MFKPRRNLSLPHSPPTSPRPPSLQHRERQPPAPPPRPEERDPPLLFLPSLSSSHRDFLALRIHLLVLMNSFS